MLSATARQLATGAGWALQAKGDGYRLLVNVGDRGRVTAWSRQATALRGRLGGPDDMLADLVPAGTVLDGELVALMAGPDGRPVQSFVAVGAAVFGGDPPAAQRLHHVAFDALRVLGEDLTARPWEERHAGLRELLAAAPPRVCAIDTLPARPECHDHIVACGFEGSVVKQRRSTYSRVDRHASRGAHHRHRRTTTSDLS